MNINEIEASLIKQVNELDLTLGQIAQDSGVSLESLNKLAMAAASQQTADLPAVDYDKLYDYLNSDKPRYHFEHRRRTLVQLAYAYNDGQLTADQLTSELESVDVYKPTKEDNPVKTVWSLGNDNSMTDVRYKLVDEGVMRLPKYKEFYQIVKKVKDID